MKLVFATNNRHKLEEVSAILGPEFEMVTPREVGIMEEIPETHNTLEGNALQKARYIHERTRLDVFADDSGLEVNALGGAPGVYSARYAGEGCSYDDNNSLLLNNLENHTDRSARFRTVIALIQNGEEHLFEGVIQGEITKERRGEGGFGYDPIFAPQGAGGQTFAQMPADKKNAMSHRAKAVKKLDKHCQKF